MSAVPSCASLKPVLPVKTACVVRETLAKAYYILARAEMDDQTYTHLSARVPGEDAYYI